MLAGVEQTHNIPENAESGRLSPYLRAGRFPLAFAKLDEQGKRTPSFRPGVCDSWTELVRHLDQADNLPVELVQFLGRHPELQRLGAAALPDGIAVKELGGQAEAGDVPGASGRGVLRVPVAGNLDCVRLGQHRVKDRLVR